MGAYNPKPYKVKRNGIWVVIKPEPVELGIKKHYVNKALRNPIGKGI